MKALLLDSAERVMVDTWAIILKQSGWDARPAHSSPEALQIAREFSPDLFITILNNIVDADPAEIVLAISRLHPACRFLLTAGRPMPDFESKLWDGGYQLVDIWGVLLHPSEFMQFIASGKSMIAPHGPEAVPKFLMARSGT